ncbi:MAG: hypothetical protein RJA63_309 [Pseudomonadota bacterium]|jgi:hypothetical protein|nr:hypothetical protein [Uliginosibacterium sp.]
MSNRSIPSDEDFARASAALKKRSRGLSQVRDKILARFQGGALHEFFILDCTEMSFRACVFYRWKLQIEEAETSGLADDIRSAVLEELESAGRGNRASVQIDFEFDSHEHVEQEYGGDYYNRLH